MEPFMFESVSAGPASLFGRVASVHEPMSTGPKTIAALFESEESPLLYYALGIVRRRIVAEELVQEAFLRLQKVWGQVENPRGWLYRTTRNLAINHLRDTHPETQLDEERAAQDQSLPRELLGRSEAIGTVR